MEIITFIFSLDAWNRFEFMLTYCILIGGDVKGFIFSYEALNSELE